jgi:hypothetical protein
MIGFAYLLGGRFAEALSKLRLAIKEDATPLRPSSTPAACSMMKSANAASIRNAAGAWSSS